MRPSARGRGCTPLLFRPAFGHAPTGSSRSPCNRKPGGVAAPRGWYFSCRVDVRARKAAGGRPSVLHCGGRREAPTALRCSVPGGERRTRPRTGGILLRRLPVLGAQTGCARRLALRRCATPKPLRSSAPQRRTPGHPPTALRRTSGSQWQESTAVHAEVRVGGRRSACCGAEQRRPVVGARLRALRHLTHRDCLSAVSAANEASFAMRPRVEQRRGVAASRRPPQ